MVSVMSRLDKINTLVRKGQPLKTWSSRGQGEVKARLEVIALPRAVCHKSSFFELTNLK